MPGHLEGKGNIFTYGSVSQELEILKNHPDRSSELMDIFETLLTGVDSIDNDLPARRFFRTEKDVKKGGFP